MPETIPYTSLSINERFAFQTHWIINPFNEVQKNYFKHDGKTYMYNPKRISKLRTNGKEYNLARAIERETSKAKCFIVGERNNRKIFIPYSFADISEGNIIPKEILEELMENEDNFEEKAIDENALEDLFNHNI